MEIAQHLPDELIQQRVSMEIDRIVQYLPDCPDRVMVYWNKVGNYLILLFCH